MGRTTTTAVLDANVLFPFTLRDTLLRSAAEGLFQPLWSSEILDEVTRNLIKKGLVNEEQAMRLVAAMNLAFPEAVVDGFHHLIDQMPNDPKDRHVAAVAYHRGAEFVVTNNLTDFRNLHDVIVVSPDEFLLEFVLDSPTEMKTVLARQSDALTNPKRTVEDLLTALEDTAPRFVQSVRAAIDGS